MASLLKNVLTKFSWFANHQIRNPKVLSAVDKIRFSSNVPTQKLTPYDVVNSEDSSAKQKLIKSDILRKVTEKILERKEPIFAVVHVAGKQFKITTGDLIIIEGYWPPDTGDRITLDKVMLVGGKSFSLIGRPLIQRDLVKIEATVIEKTVSHTKTHFRKKRRKQYKRINFYRIPQTMLQINCINFVGELNNPPDVTQTKNRTM